MNVEKMRRALMRAKFEAHRERDARALRRGFHCAACEAQPMLLPFHGGMESLSRAVASLAPLYTERNTR